VIGPDTPPMNQHGGRKATESRYGELTPASPAEKIRERGETPWNVEKSLEQD